MQMLLSVDLRFNYDILSEIQARPSDNIDNLNRNNHLCKCNGTTVQEANALDVS